MRRSSVILRDFLERALYDRSSGYFSKQVIQSGRELAFRTFASEKDYRIAVARQYADAGRAWMTPVETFQPHYAEALARSMLRTHAALYPGEPLQILEVGGGNGTCAAGVMSYLRREAPEAFERSRYMLVEVSERLADAQRQRLLAEGVPTERWEVVHSCASRWAESLEAPLPGPWFLLALEVLDNLPHDKVRIARAADGSVELHEAHVAEAEGGRRVEEWRPLRDEDVQDVVALLGLREPERALELQRAISTRADFGAGGGQLAADLQQLFSSAIQFSGADEASRSPPPSAPPPPRPPPPPPNIPPVQAPHVFVPTGCYRLLCRLLAACPEHQLILADFDWLPPQPSGAVCAPVVQTQRGGVSADLEGDYLLSPGECDVMFPTHFASLAALYAALTGRAAVPVRAAQFMARHADLAATTAEDGYNPLVEDFANVQILVTDWREGEES